MSTITVIGSINMDLVVNTPRIPILGETILGSGFMTCPGGKGANQAVAAARLGGNVHMIGCVGNDTFGKELLKNLSDNKVCTSEVKTIEGAPSGIAMITVKDGDNFIIVDPGAGTFLSPEVIEKSEDLIGNSSIILIQLEIPMDTVETAIRLARKHGVKVLLDPAPAQKLSDEFLSMIDIIKPNEGECELITGLPVKSFEDASKAINYLRSKGIPQVIITLGAKGVVYNSGSEIKQVSAAKVNVVDTTAAGDSFSGGLAVALAMGKGIDEAVKFANTVGTLTVTKKGAQASLPYLEDVQKFMKPGT